MINSIRASSCAEPFPSLLSSIEGNRNIKAHLQHFAKFPPRVHSDLSPHLIPWYRTIFWSILYDRKLCQDPDCYRICWCVDPRVKHSHPWEGPYQNPSVTSSLIKTYRGSAPVSTPEKCHNASTYHAPPTPPIEDLGPYHQSYRHGPSETQRKCGTMQTNKINGATFIVGVVLLHL